MDGNKGILQQIEDAHLTPVGTVLTEQGLIDALSDLMKMNDNIPPGAMIVSRQNPYLKKYFGICAPKWMKVKLKRKRNHK